MIRLVLILTLTVATFTAVATAPAGAGYTDPFGWQRCNSKVDFNLKITAAKNMRCKGAKRVMKHHNGSIARKFRTSGFSCKLIKGRPISGVWRCKKDRKAFKFAFGD